MAGANHVDVVLVADDGDPHQLAVETQLRSLGAKPLRLNLADLTSTQLISQTGALDVRTGNSWSRIDRHTTAWWFRAGGAIAVSGTQADEAKFIADEAPAVLIGSLRAAGVRWVDDPDVVRCAEWKLGQLALAASLDIRIPPWTATNDSSEAQRFAKERAVVAKSLSSGQGIAPFVATVSLEDLAKPSDMVTLLQERMDAAADLRLVAIDGQMWAWRRPREPETTDWRDVDPKGHAFVPLSAKAMRAWDTDPLRLTSALGLTMSIQDWLETDDGPVFLEANPQGAWLFLAGADVTVAPALAYFLHHGVKETDGKWPAPHRRGLSDFRTKNAAPQDDGVVPPRYPPAVWADEVAGVPGALDVAKSAREAAEGAAQGAEDKASRLVQVTLALLTVGLALGSFQLTFSLQHSWQWAFLLLPIVFALGCLAIAAFEAQLVDRVGFYLQPSGRDLAGIGQRDANAILLENEERGRRLARWSANHKHTDLMQARAWFTRGLVALLLAGLAAATCRATASAAAHKAQTSGSITTTSSAPSHSTLGSAKH